MSFGGSFDEIEFYVYLTPFILNAQAKSEQLNLSADIERQIASLTEEVHKAQDLNAQKILYAPVSGQIQQLAISD